MLIWKSEHLFQTLYQSVFTGLSPSVVVGEIKEVKCVETTIGPRRKLSNERREQVAAVLLVGGPKIEIKIGHCGQSAVALGNDVLDDRGANPEVSNTRLIVFDSD